MAAAPSQVSEPPHEHPPDERPETNPGARAAPAKIAVASSTATTSRVSRSS